MRMHFISRTFLLVGAAFLAVASQIWTGDTLQWIFVGAGVVMTLAAAVDGARDHLRQRSLDGLIALLGAWTIVEAFVFDGNDLKWWSFASACALAGLATIGLIVHEMSTERVVHELSVRHEARPEARV
jgi:hypothetical protein